MEVPVRAVRFAVVLRSARASKPDVESETPGTGLLDQPRKRFYNIVSQIRGTDQRYLLPLSDIAVLMMVAEKAAPVAM